MPKNHRRFEIIGHRGVPCDAPENTLAGYKRAMDLCLTHAECDLHLTRDGHLILMHDPTVDRTTNGHGRVSDFTLAQIRKLDCGSWFDRKFAGEQIPTLEQLLELVGETMHLVLEIKETQRYEEATNLVVEQVRSRGLIQSTSLTSFYWAPLEQARRLEPAIAIQALVQFCRQPPRPEQEPAQICYAHIEELLRDPRLPIADIICPRAQDLSAEMVEVLHERGFPVRVWGAQTDCREEILHVLRSGAMGMTADHPELVMSIAEGWFGSGLFQSQS